MSDPFSVVQSQVVLIPSNKGNHCPWLQFAHKQFPKEGFAQSRHHWLSFPTFLTRATSHTCKNNGTLFVYLILATEYRNLSEHKGPIHNISVKEAFYTITRIYNIIYYNEA